MYVIYGIRYKPLGNIIYIGQTTSDLMLRLSQHIESSYINKDTKMANILKLIKLEDLEIFPIERAFSQEAADRRERYYIDKYKTHLFGGNDTIGGLGTRRFTDSEEEQIKYEYIGGMIDTYGLADKYNTTRNCIVRALQRQGIPNPLQYNPTPGYLLTPWSIKPMRSPWTIKPNTEPPWRITI